ncbi:MAG: Flp pilus assembly complex ATPase component TadA [Acidobacteria bacterium]|nr:Flp pilus assembly complex ATPase component TadA [Acidobacteriota bacterium]
MAVALVDSLLTAMVRANGDALVMHVGERPIVVAGPRTIDLSTHGLNVSAMTGMLAQLLPADAQSQLVEYGAVEHRLESRGLDHFTVVAARGGDDIWIEIRRRREQPREVIDVAPPADDMVAPDVRAPEVVAADVSAPEAVAADEVPAIVDTPHVDVVEAANAGSPDSAPLETAVEQPDLNAVEVIAADDAVAIVDDDVVASTDASDVSAHEDLEPIAHVIPEEVVESAPLEDAESARVAEAIADESESAPVADVIADEHVEAAPHEDLEAAPSADATVTEAVAVEAVAVDAEAVATAADAEATDAETIDTEATEAAHAAADVPIHELVAVASAEHVIGQTTAMHTSLAEPETSMSPMDAAPESGHMPGGPSLPPVDAQPESAGAAPAIDETPMTRTVRIEVPARARVSSLDRLVQAAAAQGASALFLFSHVAPTVRVAGEMRVLGDEPALMPADIDALLAEVTPEPSRDAVHRGDPAEWLLEVADAGRVRCATFRDHRGPGAILHFTTAPAASVEQLSLDQDAILLATEPDGLVVVTGRAGSDKAAIVSAFVDTINRHRGDYVITIEPQVRTQHENRLALISQREVGTDPVRAVTALRAALRETPDVLVLADVTSAEAATLAIEAANDSRLVIVSLDANSTADAVQRLLALVPDARRDAARQQLAASFRGALGQLLLRKAAGGRVAARELLPGSRAVVATLSQTPTPQLAAALDAARDVRCPSLVSALVQLVKSGAVDVREAVRKAPDPAATIAALKDAGVDTAVVDR